MKKLITIYLAAGMLLTMGADVEGVLVDTRLLLHFDGEDGAATTFDSSPQNHPISLFNGAQLDTDVPPAMGTASLLLDGTNDYASSPDHPDWDILASSTDSWTIDFYVKQVSQGYQYYLSQGWCWSIYYENGLAFSGSGVSLSSAGPISDSDWHWIAFCKVGNEYALYKDGQQINYTKDDDTGVIDRTLDIGSYLGGFYYFNGHMDELRITHDNLFGAHPDAGLADSITNIPEPATIALLGLGSLALLRRRKK